MMAALFERNGHRFRWIIEICDHTKDSGDSIASQSLSVANM